MGCHCHGHHDHNQEEKPLGWAGYLFLATMIGIPIYLGYLQLQPNNYLTRSQKATQTSTQEVSRAQDSKLENIGN